ncbi:MAG: DUF3330 domain-containing protein [Comamonadaceae bacterium]|nr:DUF3330 domain-containing protein [Comamonadaceae bacterium]
MATLARVACNVCMKEIPLSVAFDMEAEDYVVHFCGPDCYQKWHQQENLTPVARLNAGCH